MKLIEELKKWFLKIYLPQESSGDVELVVVSGSWLNKVMDINSNVDFVMLSHNCPIGPQTVWLQSNYVTFWIQRPDDPTIVSRLFFYYATEDDIIYATEEGRRLFNYYKNRVKRYARQYIQKERNARIEFLNNYIYRPVLYYQVLCYEILSGEQLDKKVMLAIKRGKDYETLKQILYKLEFCMDEGNK